MNYSIDSDGQSHAAQLSQNYTQQSFGLSGLDQNCIQDDVFDLNTIFHPVDIQSFEPWSMPTDEVWPSGTFDFSDIVTATLKSLDASNTSSTNEDFWDPGLSSCSTASSSADHVLGIEQLRLDYFNLPSEILKQQPSSSRPIQARATSSEAQGLPSPKKSEGDGDTSRVHYASEKRYRANINGKLEELNRIVPPLEQFDLGSTRRHSTDREKRRKTTSANKAFVLEKAIKYVQYLENDHLEKEQRLAWLKSKLRSCLDVLESQEKSTHTATGQDLLREEMSLLY